MAVTLSNSGSQTCTLTTWHDVDTLSAEAGVYVLAVDMTNLALGETLDIRIATNVRAADSETVLYLATFANAQAEPQVQSVPVVVIDDATFSIRQTGGTGRAFPWAVYSL